MFLGGLLIGSLINWFMLRWYFKLLTQSTEIKHLEVYKLKEEAVIPKRNFATDAGLDIVAIEDVFIPVGETVTIPTGVAVNIPLGHVGSVQDRSSIGKAGLKIAGGIIDSSYAGEISIVMHNLTSKRDSNIYGQVGYQIKKQERIAQLLVYQLAFPACVETRTLWSSERGDQGFGSSNNKVWE